jgi:hypothetical protein
MSANSQALPFHTRISSVIALALQPSAFSFWLMTES